jgi:hypothetical protein
MWLSQSNFSKSLILTAHTLGLAAISNVLLINGANAFDITFSNGGFESGTSSWSTIGDVTTNTGIDNVTPISGSNQAIITNAYKIEGGRNDDSGLTFNQSGTNPVDADTIANNHTGQDLQTFLGLGINDLSIDRDPVVSGFPRTSKEGSGIYQDLSFTVTADDVTSGNNSFEISFNWAYLTNDGQAGNGLGNQDYSFISIFNTENSPGEITVLGDSNQSITAPNASNDYNHPTTTYYTAGNTYTQTVTGLAAGDYTYRVGFGVVDVDGYDRSSALLLDNFMVRDVPFEFSPSLGLWLVGGILGIDRLRRKFQ